MPRTATEAERAHARYNLLTTGQIADRLSIENITPDTVRSWIEETDPDRRLRAVDFRKAGATRPFWMAEWAWVEEFILCRENTKLVDNAA